MKAFLTIAAVVVCVLKRQRPSMPSEWRNVKAGMPRHEAIGAILEPLHDMRELKGYDIVTKKCSSSTWWQLQITYTSEERIDEVLVSFTDANWGLRNLNWHRMN